MFINHALRGYFTSPNKTEMQNVFITHCSSPACFDRRRDLHQGNLTRLRRVQTES